MTRVLVIDDHPIVLQGCRQLLEDAGVDDIVQAQTLADGFRLYRVQRPDVIIVDLAMRTGALGGLSFIRRLRLHDQRTPRGNFHLQSERIWQIWAGSLARGEPPFGKGFLITPRTALR